MSSAESGPSRPRSEPTDWVTRAADQAIRHAGDSLTGEGDLKVELTFESMDDFSPAAVARKVDALNKLLEARTQLSNLVTYMDGKGGAEDLLAKVLEDPALLQSLASAKKPEDGGAA